MDPTFWKQRTFIIVLELISDLTQVQLNYACLPLELYNPTSSLMTLLPNFPTHTVNFHFNCDNSWNKKNIWILLIIQTTVLTSPGPACKGSTYNIWGPLIFPKICSIISCTTYNWTSPTFFKNRFALKVCSQVFNL